jgi:hypothetical protein
MGCCFVAAASRALQTYFLPCLIKIWHSNNTEFWQLALSPSSGQESGNASQLGPFDTVKRSVSFKEKTNMSQFLKWHVYLKQTMDKVQCAAVVVAEVVLGAAEAAQVVTKLLKFQTHINSSFDSISNAYSKTLDQKVNAVPLWAYLCEHLLSTAVGQKYNGNWVTHFCLFRQTGFLRYLLYNTSQFKPLTSIYWHTTQIQIIRLCSWNISLSALLHSSYTDCTFKV